MRPAKSSTQSRKASSSLLSGYFMQPKRRSYSKSFKAQVIPECAQPGASIASMMRNHSISTQRPE
jgi:transposase-like protein